jgi:RNA polymerase sigma-54 factor
LEFTLGLEASTRLEMRPSAELVASMEMLGLARHELERIVAAELAENPALESEASMACPICMRALCGGECSLQPPRLERFSTLGALYSDDDWDPVAGRGVEASAPEQLFRDVAATLSGDDRRIAAYLVGSLDEHGFLTEPPEDAARMLRVSLGRLLGVLQAIREIGPPGIAATGIRECLLLQVDALGPDPPCRALVRAIIGHHLEALSEGCDDAIALALEVSAEAVAAAREFIRSNLEPHPLLDFVTRDPALPAEPAALLPDLVIRVSDEDAEVLEVEVLEPEWLQLRLSRGYEELAAAFRASSSEPTDQHALLAPGDRAHVEAHVERARLFLLRIRSRWETLRRVGEFLACHQRDFVLRGPEHIRPLTLVDVAAELGCHESTVSRATSNKAAQLPSGQVMPLRRFFQSSRRCRELIRQLVATEGRPLSDASLARELAERGAYVARRTVAKYRSELGIPPCHVRVRMRG